MENLNQVNAFLKAVEVGGFAAAASELQLSPSAVSKHVSQLEARLGVQLLQRTTRRLTLTAVGANYFHRCGAAMKEMRAADADAMCHDDRLRGPLRVQATAGVGQRLITPAIINFMAFHPDLQIALDIDSVPHPALAREADCLITVAHRGETPGAGIASNELAEVSYVVCAAPSYLKAFGRPKREEDLAEHHCLVHEAQRAARTWRFSRRGKEVTININGPFATNHAMALETAVLAGRGIGRIPDYVVSEHVKARRLVVLFDNLVAWGQVITAFFPVGPQSVRVKAFINYLQDVIPEAARPKRRPR